MAIESSMNLLDTYHELVKRTLKKDFDAELDIEHYNNVGKTEINSIEDSNCREIELYMLRLYGEVKHHLEDTRLYMAYRTTSENSKLPIHTFDDLIWHIKYEQTIEEYGYGLCKRTEILDNAIRDNNEELYMRFAFFILRVTAMRIEDYPIKLKEYTENAPEELQKLDIFVQYLLNAYNSLGIFKKADVEELLQKTDKLKKYYNYNMGALNAASDLMANLSANGLLDKKRKPELNDYIEKMEDGIRLVQDHPTFHATLCKLYCEIGKYDDSIKEMNVAINSYEFYGREQRIMAWRETLNYVIIRSNIDKYNEINTEQLSEKVKEMTATMDKQRKEIDELQIKNEQLVKDLTIHYTTTITIITAIISLIVGSMNLVGAIDINNAVIFMIAFAIILGLFIGILIWQEKTFCSKTKQKDDERTK